MFLCSTCSSGGRSQVQTFQALPFFAKNLSSCIVFLHLSRERAPLQDLPRCQRSKSGEKNTSRERWYHGQSLRDPAAFFFSRKKRSHIKQSKCKLQTPLSLIKCESQKTASLLVGANAAAIAFFKQSKEKPLASP